MISLAVCILIFTTFTCWITTLNIIGTIWMLLLNTYFYLSYYISSKCNIVGNWITSKWVLWIRRCWLLSHEILNLMTTAFKSVLPYFQTHCLTHRCLLIGMSLKGGGQFLWNINSNNYCVFTIYCTVRNV